MSELRDLQISPRRRLPARLLSARSVRAAGPGGQNVNKVATKVELRLDLGAARSMLGDANLARIRRRLAGRIDGQGRLRVVCGSQRQRVRNLETATRRMERLLAAALARPRPRAQTRPTRASRERRLGAKRHRAALKRRRGAPSEVD